MTIYWLTTPDKHEDWFVVAVDQYVAERYFSEMEGYSISHVYAKEVCPLEIEEPEYKNEEAYFPSHTTLINNGFEAISEDEPMVYWKNGHKYCQGNILQRILINEGRVQEGVYIVAVQNTGLYKIGKTKDIENRLSQLQTGNPFEFYLYEFFVTIKSRELETELHRKYKRNRYKGEWYKMSEEDLSLACAFARSFIGKPYMALDSFTIPGSDVLKNNSATNNSDDLPF